MIKLIRYVLLAYTFTSIVFFDTITTIPSAIGGLLCLLYVIYLVAEKKKFIFPYPLVVMALLVISAFLTVLYNNDVLSLSITSALILILNFAVINIVYESKSAVDFMRYGFYLGLIGSIVITIVQGPSYNEWGNEMRVDGTLGNSNFYSFILAFGILFCVLDILSSKSRKQKVFFFLLIAIYFQEVLNTGSRTGLVLASLIVLFLVRELFKKSNFKERLVIVIGSLSVLAILINVLATSAVIERFSILIAVSEKGSASDFSFLERISFAREAIRLWSEKPFFGWGFDQFKYLNVYKFTYSHNNYLELLANHGLIGLILFYSINVYMIKLIYNKAIKHGKNNLFAFTLIFVVTLLVMDIGTVRILDKVSWFLLSYVIGSLLREIDQLKNGTGTKHNLEVQKSNVLE